MGVAVSFPSAFASAATAAPRSRPPPAGAWYPVRWSPCLVFNLILLQYAGGGGDARRVFLILPRRRPVPDGVSALVSPRPLHVIRTAFWEDCEYFVSIKDNPKGPIDYIQSIIIPIIDCACSSCFSERAGLSKKTAQQLSMHAWSGPDCRPWRPISLDVM